MTWEIARDNKQAIFVEEIKILGKIIWNDFYQKFIVIKSLLITLR